MRSVGARRRAFWWGRAAATFARRENRAGAPQKSARQIARGHPILFFPLWAFGSPTLSFFFWGGGGEGGRAAESGPAFRRIPSQIESMLEHRRCIWVVGYREKPPPLLRGAALKKKKKTRPGAVRAERLARAPRTRSALRTRPRATNPQARQGQPQTDARTSQPTASQRRPLSVRSPARSRDAPRPASSAGVDDVGESPGISDQSVGARAPPRCDHEEAGRGRPRCRSVVAERGRVRHPASARSVGGVHLAARAAGHQSTTTHQPFWQPTNACCTSHLLHLAHRMWCGARGIFCTSIGMYDLRWLCLSHAGLFCARTEGRKKKKTRKSIDRKRCSDRSMLRSIRLTAGSFRAVTEVGKLASFPPHKFSDADRVCGGALQHSVVSPRSHASQGGFRAIRIPHSFF